MLNKPYIVIKFVEDIIVHGVDLMQEVSCAIETLLLVICTSDTTGENLKPLMVKQFFYLYIYICVYAVFSLESFHWMHYSYVLVMP